MPSCSDNRYFMEFDVAMIGTGMAGLTVALRLAKSLPSSKAYSEKPPPGRCKRSGPPLAPYSTNSLPTSADEPSGISARAD
jgi:flavin-dependent dehydrogenase